MRGCASAARLIAKNLSVRGVTSEVTADAYKAASPCNHREPIAKKRGECRRDEKDAAKRLLTFALLALAGLIPAVNLLVAIGKNLQGRNDLTSSEVPECVGVACAGVDAAVGRACRRLRFRCGKRLDLATLFHRGWIR